MVKIKHTPMALICLVLLCVIFIVGCVPEKTQKPADVSSTTSATAPTQPTGFVPSPHRHIYEVISHETSDEGPYRIEKCSECGKTQTVLE